MAVDKLTLQGWIAGAEVNFKKARTPLARVPWLNRIERLAAARQNYTLSEAIDLTRARDFQVQQGTEDLLVASIDLPFLGKRTVGNDIGMAVASFDYTDREGDNHKIIAICAYAIGGITSKIRELRKIILIPMA